MEFIRSDPISSKKRSNASFLINGPRAEIRLQCLVLLIVFNALHGAVRSEGGGGWGGRTAVLSLFEVFRAIWAKHDWHVSHKGQAWVDPFQKVIRFKRWSFHERDKHIHFCPGAFVSLDAVSYHRQIYRDTWRGGEGQEAVCVQRKLSKMFGGNCFWSAPEDNVGITQARVEG